jgi:Alpha/beta hydrolase family
MAATQRPWSGAAYAGPSGPAGWRSIPLWYLVGTEDRAVPPAGQRFMAERANATIEEVPASHASMVSQPEAVTRLILTPSRRHPRISSYGSRQGGVRLTAAGLERAGRAALVVGASFSHHAQGGGIWPDGSWHARPQPYAPHQPSRLLSRPRPATFMHGRLRWLCRLRLVFSRYATVSTVPVSREGQSAWPGISGGMTHSCPAPRFTRLG